MTKTVEDASLLLKAVAGYEPEDPLSVTSQVDFDSKLDADLRGVRLAVPTNFFWEFDAPGDDAPRPGLDPEVAAAVRTAIARLQDLGASVDEIELQGVEELVGGQGAAMVVERAFFFQELPPERMEMFSPQYRDGLLRGKEVKALEYLSNLETLERIVRFFSEALSPYDAMVCPTVPVVAPTIASVTGAAGRGSPAAALGRYCSPFNRSGHPALSLPCGMSQEGLPIGMMLVGNHFDDAKLLRIGAAYQIATDWHARRPAILSRSTSSHVVRGG
jgi:aspartyl-tRNA(Asn)/glutamyl-tRNA(Gln) amidotransferase subunit A